jgi:uncharacterized glyoxalase superfamily protein PhnB
LLGARLRRAGDSPIAGLAPGACDRLNLERLGPRWRWRSAAARRDDPHRKENDDGPCNSASHRRPQRDAEPGRPERGRAIEFYKRVFGAEEIARFAKSDGRIWHAELRIGDSVLFLSDELPHSTLHAPSPEPFPSNAIRIYVADVDAVFGRALEAGARSLRNVADTFWGDRIGIVADPFGHTWVISTHLKDVPAKQVRRAGEELTRASTLQTAGIMGVS